MRLYTTAMRDVTRKSIFGWLTTSNPGRRGFNLIMVIMAGMLTLSGCSIGSNRKSTTPSAASATTAAVIQETASGTSQSNPIVSGSPQPTVEATATGEVPHPTGTQTLTMSGGAIEPTTLDPALVRDADSAFIARQIFRGLVKLTPDLKPAPDLAGSIDTSSDQSTYTFHLRKGIEFSSGKPIRASDVQYSLERAASPEIATQAGGSAPAMTFLSDIAGFSDFASGKTKHVSGIQVVNDTTLKITLSSPVADFLVKLAGTPALVIDQSNVQSGGNWWRSPDASGPFSIASWKSGQQMVLTANPHYVTQPATLKTVNILFGVNAGDPFTLYERNQVDFASVPADAIDRVQSSNSPYRNQLVVQPLLSASYILLNPNIAPFNDINVRKALIMAFDRQKIANVTYDGHVKVANGIVPQGLDGIDWTANVPSYDPSAAKSLLQKSSLASSGGGVILYTNGDYSPVAMKLQLEQNLGLKADVVQLQWPDYIGQMEAHQLPAMTLDWIADYPDPEDFLRVLFHTGASDNSIGYSNPAVDKLLDEALAEPDANKRAALYQQAQQKIIDDAVVIPLYTDIDYELIEPYVHGLQITPVGILGLESVWITK